MSEDFSDCIEVAGQLVHVSCRAMPKVMESDVRQIAAAQELREIVCYTLGRHWRTISLGDNKAVIVVGLSRKDGSDSIYQPIQWIVISTGKAEGVEYATLLDISIQIECTENLHKIKL